MEYTAGGQQPGTLSLCLQARDHPFMSQVPVFSAHMLDHHYVSRGRVQEAHPHFTSISYVKCSHGMCIVRSGWKTMKSYSQKKDLRKEVGRTQRRLLGCTVLEWGVHLGDLRVEGRSSHGLNTTDSYLSPKFSENPVSRCSSFPTYLYNHSRDFKWLFKR